MSKGLLALEKICNNFPLNSTSGFIIPIEKELKALNIILDCCDIELYRNRQGQCFIKIENNLFAISKEKYDLLKEVFYENRRIRS